MSVRLTRSGLHRMIICDWTLLDGESQLSPLYMTVCSCLTLALPRSSKRPHRKSISGHFFLVSLREREPTGSPFLASFFAFYKVIET